jgi:hypothetical protein
MVPSVLIIYRMTKTEVIELLEMRSGAQLARLLGISRSAVAQWPDDQPIPEKQLLRLRYELRPDVFGPAPSADQKAA